MNNTNTGQEDCIGHILPRSGNEKQCEAWVKLFEKFEGVEFEKVSWDGRRNAYRIQTGNNDE